MLSELQLRISDFARKNVNKYTINEIALALNEEEFEVETAVHDLVKEKILIAEGNKFIIDVEYGIFILAGNYFFHKLLPSDILFLNNHKDEISKLKERLEKEKKFDNNDFRIKSFEKFLEGPL
ncbi:hypothetical protein B2I21_09860 [Chryseobacterium mucoviscidosis]|nr:hypothetical protein B2I21_09860 [Chryseobacterium mucoviscidosis]